MSRRAVIHNRRFYWQDENGRLSPVRVTERLMAQVRQASYQTQVQAAQRAIEAAAAPSRRTNHPPRPLGTAPTLPPANRDICDKTLTDLAHDYGWGSVYRFSEAIRKNRRAIYDAARANGRERANANLMTPPPERISP